MKILAVDWGKRNLGLALSESGVLGRELPAVATDVERLADFIRKERIDQVVIGLPTKPDSTEGPQATTVRTFGDELVKKTGVAIVYEDEAFSSDEAKRLGGDHSLAARLVLEQYLHHHAQ